MRSTSAKRRAARDAEDLVPVDELARVHRASASQIRRAIAAGELEAVRYGDFLRVRRRAFLEWHVGRLRGAAIIVDR